MNHECKNPSVCRNQSKCDDCGEMLCSGEYPFCPHGLMGRGSTTPFPEHVDDYNFAERKVFTSAHEMDIAFKKHNLVPARRFWRSDKGKWV